MKQNFYEVLQVTGFFDLTGVSAGLSQANFEHITRILINLLLYINDGTTNNLEFTSYYHANLERRLIKISLLNL